MRISEGIVKYLENIDVEYIFGMSAGTVSALYDSLNDVNIKPIICKNEAGAAYMAARYACVSKKLGVCIGAGGVGTNNMINGIADAMRSKAPVLIITGYVQRWQIGKGAIQELDTEAILKPITKYSRTILEEVDVIPTLVEAIQMAFTPPYGPVHISIPIDIQVAPLMQEIPKELVLKEEIYDDISLETAIEAINEANRGIIMVGKGCRGISQEVMELSQHLQWPIITTPEGKGVIHHDFPLNLGNYGFSSSELSSHYVERMKDCCLLILGSSLGESATKNYNEELVKSRNVIHIDWDKHQLGKVFKTDIDVHFDLKLAIPKLLEKTNPAKSQFKKINVIDKYIKNHTGLSLRLVLEKITNVLPSNTYYVSDIGEYMNFLFKYLRLPEGSDFEIGLNYGAMGSGIAGGIGVHLANPNRPTVIFSGDGSFLMNGTEILTAKEYKMPIIYFIVNNAMMGYVEHGHNIIYGRSVEGFRQERISIVEMMRAIGVKSMAVNTLEDLIKVPDFINNLNGPCVIELITDGSEAAPIADRIKALSGKTQVIKEENVC